MKSRILLVMLTTLFLAIPSLAFSQSVPAKLPVQGYLTDSSGVPVDGSVTVDFKIYASATGGSALHDESLSVEADAGAFTAYLGTNDSLDTSIFENNSELYLGIAVDGDSEMSPRLELGSVPYAAVAGNATNAESLGGTAASDYLTTSTVPSGLTSGCSDGQVLKWSDSSSGWECAADASGSGGTSYSAGSGVDISGGTISVDSNGCSSGQVLKWDGSAWGCANDQSGSGGTTYSAGSGIDISGGTISASGISNADISSSADISGSKLETDPAFNGTVEADNFAYSSSRTVHHLVAASEFTNESWNEGDSLTLVNGYLIPSRLDGDGKFVLEAPVEIPPAAEITQGYCYYEDSSNGSMVIDAEVRRVELHGSGDGGWRSVSSNSTTTSGNTPDDLQSVSLSFSNTPVLEEWHYFINVKLDPSRTSGGLRFYGWKFNYETDEPSP